jgi:23S rRNA pseudouridine1911/1915/1917 synthase
LKNCAWASSRRIGEVQVEIVYTAGACLVINKAPGESTEAPLNLPGGALAGTAKGFPRAVHRLDVPVSGCVLYARNRQALSFLGAAFAEDPRETTKTGGVKKIYWAVVEMPPPALELPESGELLHWIEKLKGNKSAAFDEPKPGRQRALLRYRITGRGTHYLFLEIELVTGRHHQIRAQLARMGLHIKGDLKYGARRSEKKGGIRLHAYSLRFPDLRGGDPLTVCALPRRNPGETPDPLWQAFMDALAKTPAIPGFPIMPASGYNSGNA